MKSQKGKLAIGPLRLRSATPQNIYATLLNTVGDQVAKINDKYTTQLNFIPGLVISGNGRFNRHLDNLENALEWVERYEVPMLNSLNCSHNVLPTLRSITIFYLPRLAVLDLFDCQIESIELLTNCFFPNLLTLILYNNHLLTIRSLRRCYFPFLCELIVDSNNVLDVGSLSQIYSSQLQKLELHNNRMIDWRAIMKFNCPYLVELRVENWESVTGREKVEQVLRTNYVHI